MFAEALTAIIHRLDDAAARGLLQRYALVGGFAVSAWGVPRATHDLDFAVVLGSSDPRALSQHLHAEFRPGGPDDPLRGVFRTHISAAGREVPVQLILLPEAWTAIILDGIETLSVAGCLVPVVSWQSLLLLKVYAGGPQDLLDAKQVLAVRQPSREELTDLVDLADRVQLAPMVRRLFQEASKP